MRVLLLSLSTPKACSTAVQAAHSEPTKPPSQATCSAVIRQLGFKGYTPLTTNKCKAVCRLRPRCF